MNAVTWCMDRRIVAGSIAFWNTTTGKWLKHFQFGREDTLGISGFCAMSRCFPFPPPGYEGKSRTDDVDLLKKVNTIFLYCANCLTCHYLECKTGFLCELSVKCAWIRFIFHVASWRRGCLWLLLFIGSHHGVSFEVPVCPDIEMAFKNVSDAFVVWFNPGLDFCLLPFLLI